MQDLSGEDPPSPSWTFLSIYPFPIAQLSRQGGSHLLMAQTFSPTGFYCTEN